MRNTILLTGVGLFLVAAALMAWLWLGIGHTDFEAQGRVVGFADGGRAVYVEHDAIDGFRGATTTPFQMETPPADDSLKVGDAVVLQFTVGSGQAQVTEVEKLPDNAIPQNPASADEEQTEAASGATLNVGEQVPDVALVNQTGERVHLSDFRGQALFVTFIYTECPQPDFCPLMSKQFAALQPKLNDAFGEEAHLLSISFDPENDTPSVLTEYGRKYTEDFSTWTFATPTTPDELEEAKEAFGITTIEKEGEIVHNLATALIDPDGRLVWTWRGNDWEPEDLLEVADETLEGSSPVETRAEQ